MVIFPNETIMALKTGDRAPDFSAPATDGRTVSLSDFRGRKLVLYFYPMDDTPGCTAQACSLRDGADSLRARDVAVLGVSAQDVATHQRFTQKFKLNFPLLADTDRRVADAYGALGSGPLAWLRRHFGFYKRVTYVIDEDGRIAHIIDRPDTKRHAEEVLQQL